MKTFLLLLALVPTVMGASEPKDFIVVQDLGPVLESSRNNILSVFLNVILKNYLKSQNLDHFHLIGMGRTPRVMFTQHLFDKATTESFLINLSKVPSEPTLPDLPAALDATRGYISSLANDKAKFIVLIMDGKTPGGTEEERWKNKLLEFQAIATSHRWTFKIVLIPFDGRQPDIDLTQLWAQDLPVYAFDTNEDFTNRLLGSPLVTWPKDLGTQGRRINLGLSFRNFEPVGVVLMLRDVVVEGNRSLERPVTVSLPPNGTKDVVLPLIWEEGPDEAQSLTPLFELEFEDGHRAFPDRVRVSMNYTATENWAISPAVLILLALAVLLAVLLIWLMIRLFHFYSQPGHYVSATEARRRVGHAVLAASSTDHSDRAAKISAKSIEIPAKKPRRETRLPRPAKEILITSTNTETFYAEIWTDDYLFQNTAGGRGLFKFAANGKKILGDPLGVPVRILRTPALGEFFWDGSILWFQAWDEAFGLGSNPVTCSDKELIWHRPHKKSLHILLKPWVSEAEKFRRFLKKMGES